jgi:hypothetical protein
MKTYGLLPEQILASLETDEEGNFIPPLEDGVTAVPLVKLPEPDVSPTEIAEPNLVWFDDRVERQWTVRARTPEELVKIWSNAQTFMAEFTTDEKAGIANSTDTTVAALRLEISTWFSQVFSNDPRVIAGLDKLVELDIITEARKEEIVAL